MTDNPQPPVGKRANSKRMALTDEEVRLVENFRHQTAVARAFDEGLDTAIAVLRNWEKDTGQDPILFEEVYRVLERQKKHAKVHS